MMGTVTGPGLRRVPSLFSSEGGRLLRVGGVGEPISATLTRASSLRFWYGATIPEFLGSQTDAVVGRLDVNCDFALVDVELCVYATATLLFFCWSSDHPLALARLSKITGKILLLKNVSVPGWHNHCRFPAPVVKQLCPKFCSTISRSF